NYSRKFESEADLYALQLMDRKNIEVSHFANFLQRLNDKTEEDLNKASQSTSPTSQKESSDNKLSIAVVDALSSHPATEERIRMVHDFEKKQHAKY
ncbi:M48 family metalloprotease, partial [Acinetobacter baumannii]